MKILDKYKDYYDFYQNIYIDNSLVFDRRGSIKLGDSYFLSNLPIYNDTRRNDLFAWNKQAFFILQVGYSNWVFKAVATKSEVSPTGSKYNTDYKIELIESWKDYNHLNSMRFGLAKTTVFTQEHGYIKDMLKHYSDEIYLIKLGNYEIKSQIDNPIFEGSKIPSVLDAWELYQAIEEYFSSLKSEKIVDNQTDLEKIESHGFDKKESFRNIK